MAKTIEILKAEIAERQAELKPLQSAQENEDSNTQLSDSEIDEIIKGATR